MAEINELSVRRSVTAQLLFGLVAVSGAISSGIILGFSAVSLPQLTAEVDENTDEIYLNSNQASWFASLPAIVSPIGCLLCGPLLDRFGRKICLLLVNLPALIAWLLLATAHGPLDTALLSQLYIARIFAGLAVGMASIPGTLYLAEIASSNKLRSMLVTWTSIGISFGILLVYTLGAIIQESWQLVAALCALVPLCAVVATFFALPESPVWLLSRGSHDEALRSLRTLRGLKRDALTPQCVQDEIKEMAARSRVVMRDSDNKGGENLSTIPVDEGVGDGKSASRGWMSRTRTTVNHLLQPETIKPLLIMIGLFFFQQFSGIYVVIFYAVDILIKAGVTLDAYLATVLLGLVQFIAGIAVCFALRRFGRRPMSIVSGVGMSGSLFALGAYLQLKGDFSWFPLVAMLTFVIFGMIGFHTIPWALLGEIYPLHVKGVAAGITTCMGYVFSFVALKIYPQLFYITNSEVGIFYFYGIVSLLATIFVIVFLPETHKKTLAQIQEEFTKKVKNGKAESEGKDDG